jgi:hypothetical protein
VNLRDEFSRFWPAGESRRVDLVALVPALLGHVVQRHREAAYQPVVAEVAVADLDNGAGTAGAPHAPTAAHTVRFERLLDPGQGPAAGPGRAERDWSGSSGRDRRRPAGTSEVEVVGEQRHQLEGAVAGAITASAPASSHHRAARIGRYRRNPQLMAPALIIPIPTQMALAGTARSTPLRTNTAAPRSP